MATENSVNNESNPLEDAYTRCITTINALKQCIKAFRNKHDQSILSTYLKSETAYHPTANKESNGTLRFQCRNIFKGHFNKIHALSWSNNGYLSSTQDQALIIWSSQGAKICVITLSDFSGMALDFSCKHGDYVASGGLDNECTIHKINYSESESVHHTKMCVLSKHSGFISDCILMNDSTELATSSGDGTIKIWDIENSCPTQEFHGHQSDVMAISECNIEYFENKNSEKLLLSASTDGSCKIWDYRINEANNCVHSYYLSDADVNCCSWFPDGQSFAAGSEDGSIKLMDIRTHRQLNVYESEKKNAVHSVCFSKSGYFLFAGIVNLYVLCV